MLRKGIVKNTLTSSIESALLAVEIYNKPKVEFKVESYITLMIMAWTRLFHAYFHKEIGDKYYYKEKNGKYKKVDGEKKAWELNTCIRAHNKLPLGIKANLDFFIRLRNKIEHRHINKDELGMVIFGECQALLYNYENTLIDFFGEEYSINESLAYSLQFSRVKTKEQEEASRMLLSNEIKNINDFINKYRSALTQEVFDTQEYSIKLIQIPKISNTNRAENAIEFVTWNNLSNEDKEKFEKLNVLIKDKVIKVEAANVGKYKAGEIVKLVSKKLDIKFSHYDHNCLFSVFSIRPKTKDFSKKDCDRFNTTSKYCIYDEAHEDYVYSEEWLNFIIYIIRESKVPKEEWKNLFKAESTLNIKEYEI